MDMEAEHKTLPYLYATLVLNLFQLFQGAVTLVTGGASGLGKATVERLIQQGSKIVICDLPTSKGNEFAKSLGEDKALFTPVNVKIIPVNFHSLSVLTGYFQVSSEEDVKNALDAVKEKFGKLNNVVNCAGIGVAFKTYNFKKNMPHSLEDFTKVLMVSLCLFKKILKFKS